LKNKPIFKFGVLALSLVLIACSGGSSEAGCPEIDGRELNVVATTPMIGEFVSQVGGDSINLTVLMPPEADPHTYEPAPQDAGKIADADLVFYTGLMYEPAPLIELLENSVCGSEALAEVGESVFPIEFKEAVMMTTMVKKDMMTMTKKDMMTMTKKDMMTMTKKDMMTMTKKDMMTMTKKDMMTMTKKDMMTMTKKDMMTITAITTEHTTLTFGSIQTELHMQQSL